MRKLFVALLLVLGAAFLVMPAFAQDEFPAKMMNAKMAQEMNSKAMRLGGSAVDPGLNDTTFVGFNPAYSGSNYWSIGVGARRPPGTHGSAKSDIPAIPSSRTGYWDWDHPVHGDSLQGWWPVRHIFTAFLANQSDLTRPWTCFDQGNQLSQVVNQGPAYRRLSGVTSAWHQDIGNNGGVMTLDPSPNATDVNPKAPNWTPIAGSGSAWCGLRTHGDVTRMDPQTGNPYNEDALGNEIVPGTPAVPTGPGWTYYKFPGYGDGWDQMLYRDVDITNATGSVSVGFSYRTRMSTGKTTTATRVCGWFDKDPLTQAVGNFVSGTVAGATTGAPIDSFMVYVGCPVADTVGSVWLGSDGSTHPVFDPQRRWLAELVQANPPTAPAGLVELFTTYGNQPPLTSGNNAFNTTTVGGPTYSSIRSTWGNKIRLVFRIKTNRGKGTNATETPSSDMSGSLALTYSSGGLGAAEVDDVNINLGGGPVSLGHFESQGEIDNSPKASALDVWKTSSKPPGVYHHVDELTNGALVWHDLCGPPGSIYRICDLAGNVISAGDHDNSENFNGPPGTPELERFDGIVSPTINLCYNHAAKNATGCTGGPNNMGLDCDTSVPTSEFALLFNIYAGGLNVFDTGQLYQAFAESYPAQQNDGGLNGLTGPTEGVRCWGAFRFANFAEFNPDPQCYDERYDLGQNSQIQTTNGNGVPDSVRVGMRKLSECFAFPTSTCGQALGLYWDNVSFAIIDGTPLPMSVDIWQWFQDTFPANESLTLPGTAGFDTCAALIQGSLNGAPTTNDLTRYDSPQDSIFAVAGGDSVEVQLKFRIWPGPGNYVIEGNQCSGLRRVPTDTTRIQATDMALADNPQNNQKKFWTAYILDPGKSKAQFPTTGACQGGGTLRHDQRWNELVWCNARCDTAENNLFPILSRGLGTPAPGQWSSTYHESDPKYSSLGILRNKCFLIDTAGVINYTNTTCTSAPPWTALAGKGYDGNLQTKEGTKILPDGIFTPGTHVEYFFFKKDLNTGGTAMVPDTNFVYPQVGEGPNFDGHRWQEFSVLPDLWKPSANCGLGRAAMLYYDWNDRRGDEVVWKGVADSIGATQGTRLGANDGYVGKSKDDLNDPSTYVNRNCSAGTTWDMYGFKASESLNNGSGSIGARLAYRAGGTLLTAKPARNAPTAKMLQAYYRILFILSGDLNSGILGPFADRSQDDTGMIHNYLLSGQANAHRGLFVGGSGFAEDADGSGNSQIETDMAFGLKDASYLRFSGNSRACVDLLPQSPITTRGDIYGMRNVCTETQDVLTTQGDGVAASLYDPVGANPLNAPYIASVFLNAEGPNLTNHWQSLLDGWNTWWMRSRGCDKTTGRLVYYINVFTNVFGKICAVAGAPNVTTEVPNNNDGSTFVDFAGIGNNPLRQGSAVINLTLATPDRVTVKIFDVSGRLVRTLADGQMFKAGKVDPALTWDGLDNSGRQVARGAYFVSVKYQNSRYDISRKMIVLK